MLHKKHFEITSIHEFPAAHFLRNVDGPCSRLHGHNFKLEITVSSPTLDNNGFCIDFFWLEKLIEQSILSKVDHRCLNDIPPFDTINPTCENILLWCEQQLENLFNTISQEITLLNISLWENSKFKVTLRKDKA